MFPPAVPASWRPALCEAAGVTALDELLGKATAGASCAQVPDRVLEQLEAGYQVAERDVAEIPRTGAAVVLSNHPFGLLDAVALASLLLSVRPDVKFLANPALAGLHPLRELTIPLDPFLQHKPSQANASGLREALGHLRAGGLLAIFPAGEVSHLQWAVAKVCDSPWPAAVARFLRLARRFDERISLLPAFVEGRNSLAFQAAGLLHPALRTALLARELLNKRSAQVGIRIGRRLDARKVLENRTDDEAIEYLRWRSELLARREQPKARTAWPLRRDRSQLAPIAAAINAERLAGEIAALPQESLLASSGALDVYVAPADQLPLTLLEIGRLREVTFREAGEGTGLAADLDQFDAHYLHLFLWNRESREIAGAYRLRTTDDGVKSLYTAKLFRYDQAFLDRLGPAWELGRSFVARPYQRDFAPLLLLWKGIGKVIAGNPRYKRLFGPVSISAGYTQISRRIMAGFLRRFAWLDELSSLVRGRHPFEPEVGGRALDLDDLSSVVSDLEGRATGVPVLIRHYLKLGGKLLGFSVDPEFSEVVDGLIVVDLTQTDERLLPRYLGKAEAEGFLAFHRRQR